MKEKGGPTTALGNLVVKDGQPPTVATFGLRALPPGVKLENVTLDAAFRKKVIDGSDEQLNEYYVEPRNRATDGRCAEDARRPKATTMPSQTEIRLRRG